MTEYLVSVCLITYNHEKFIAKAIESVLMQKTNFKFQLVIADDCSTDGSKKILLNFKDKYPDRIHLILQQTNIGPAKNWIDLLSFPRSKYLAYFEGDDYWTDPNKLQKQFDFLESNDDFGLVYTKSSVEVNGKISSKQIGNPESFYSLFEFNFIPTLTVMFRSVYFESFTSKFHTEILEWKIGDYPLWLWIYINSKLKFLDYTTSVHRVVRGSESNKGNRLIINLESFKIANFFLKNYNIKESLKSYLVRRAYLLLVCIKNEPEALLKILKNI
jgi:glycosyltransferase involved in cell wall biosynthesis